MNVPDTQNKLYLYEALELRAEYDARINTLKDCLPEAKQNRNRSFFDRDERGQYRPSPEFSVSEVRQQLDSLEVRRRKLNSAIQLANFQHRLEYGGETINLSEALELRKGLNTRIGELHTRLVEAAYQRVIYKEDRDIVEPSELSYPDCAQDLEDARLAFRELNRRLRTASFETIVDYQDDA